MKIAIPSDDRKTITGHFGRVAGFIVLTVENTDITNREYRENPVNGRSAGPAERHKGILDTIGDCTVVLSNGMGRPMFAQLQKLNKEVIATDILDVDRAVTDYLQGTLSHNPELIHEHRHHHHQH